MPVLHDICKAADKFSLIALLMHGLSVLVVCIFTLLKMDYPVSTSIMFCFVKVHARS